MKRVGIGIALALIVNLAGTVVPAGAQQTDTMPDYGKITAGAYLLDDNEDSGESFIDWRSTTGKFEAVRNDNPAGTDSRLEQRVRKLAYIDSNYTRNYFKYGDGQVDSASGKWGNLAEYSFFSFWYKGDGQSNQLTFAITKKDGSKLAAMTISIPQGDEAWHFFSRDMESMLVSGGSMSEYSAVKELNVSLATRGSSVLVDNLLFSALDPENPDAQEPIDPTPTPDPGNSETGAPEEGDFYEDMEEGGSAFIKWMGDGRVFATERTDNEAGAPARLGILSRKLASGEKLYQANWFQGDIIDLSPHQYFSFWYKGNGAANTLTVAVRSGSGGSGLDTLIMEAKVNTAAGDTDWHFFSAPMSGLKGGGTGDIAKAQRMNVSLANAGTVYIDNIWFSQSDPVRQAPDFAVADLDFGSGNTNGNLAAGQYTVRGVVLNNTNTAQTMRIIAASYNSAGKLTGLTAEDITVQPGENPFQNAINIVGGENNTVRVMLWRDGFAQMCPAAAPAE